MIMNTIITIGRQYGSAGRHIGEELAAKLGIKVYAGAEHPHQAQNPKVVNLND